jgi:hypothetical protein
MRVSRVYNKKHVSGPKSTQMNKAIKAGLKRQHTKSKYKLRKPR